MAPQGRISGLDGSLWRRAEQASSAVAPGTKDIYPVFGFFTALSTLALCLRAWSRRLKGLRLFWDDYLICIAWALTIIQGALLCRGVAEGTIGHHTWTLKPEQLVVVGKRDFVSTILQMTSLLAAKIAVLIQLHRVFFVIRRFQIFLYALDAILVMHYLAMLFAYVFICKPVSAQWDPSVPHHCGDLTKLNVAPAIPWIITDFAIVFAPIPVLRVLKISRFKKVLISCLFLCGLATSIVACIRYAKLLKLEWDDLTYTGVDTLMWAVIENNVTLICASIVVIKPAISSIGRWVSSSKSELSRKGRRLQPKSAFSIADYISIHRHDNGGSEEDPERQWMRQETRFTVSRPGREKCFGDEVIDMEGLKLPTTAHTRG